MTLQEADRGLNNFDLIRLLAALQVMVTHSLDHFGFGHEQGLAGLLGLFPGVPIFFVISGYLVARSYDQSASIADFARRRIARIYPGLWGALAFCAATILVLHPIDTGTFVLWLAAQATFGQDWHPAALRSYGSGVVNGPLWSVCVEIALYVAVPFVARLRTRWLAIIASLSFAALYIGPELLSAQHLTALYVTPIMWAGMFLTGTMIYRLRARPRLRVWLPAFIIAAIASRFLPAPEFLLRATGNQLGLVNFVALTGLVFACAYARPIKVPGDISYGLYLYHMPVLNVVLALGFAGAEGIAITALGAVLMAFASWHLIEHPMLRRHKAVGAEGGFKFVHLRL